MDDEWCRVVSLGGDEHQTDRGREGQLAGSDCEWAGMRCRCHVV